MNEPVTNLTTLDRGIKLVKDLSAAVVLQLMALGLVYFVAIEIRPILKQIPALAEALTIHEQHQSDFYQRHLGLMEENVRLARLQCVTYQESLHRPSALCQGAAR